MPAYVKAKALLDQAQAIVNSARGRSMTPDEIAHAKNLIRRAEDAKNDADLTYQIDAMQARMSAPYTKGLGDRLYEAGLARTVDGALSVKGQVAREVIIPAFATFGVKAPTVPAGTDIARSAPVGVEPLGADQRFMYPSMPTQDVGTDLSIQDFRETVRGTTGTIERDPVAVTGKATLNVTVTAVNTPVKQEALILDGIPNAVLESLTGFRAFADSELRFQIQKAIDAHVYTNVNANATFGTSGTTMVDKLRNAVTAVQADGFQPNLAVLNPTDAAALDLTADAGGYVFPLRDTGTSSPLWGLRIVTRTSTAGTEPALVIDTTRIGLLYMGTMRFDLDPFSGVSGNNFENNTTDIRCEVNVLMHVRSAKAARRVAAT
jgi:Phage capsid family